MQIRHFVTEPDILIVVERGEEIPSVIQDVCLKRDLSTAFVTGSGAATWITIDSGPAGRRRIDGPLELLSLTGTLEQRGTKLDPTLRVVASRELDTGPQIVGGTLVEARLEKGIFRVSRHVPAGKIPVETGSSAWSAVAAVSAELPEEEEPDDDVMPRVGDTVDHPKFGHCKVRGIDDDHIRIRLNGGRTVSLGLSRLSFSLRGELSDGKRIYTVIVNKN